MEQKYSNEEVKMTASEKFGKLQDKAINISSKAHELSENTVGGGLNSLISNAKQRIKESKKQNQRPLDKSNIRTSNEIER